MKKQIIERVILCDSREQRPPALPSGYTYERVTLAEGDYTTRALLDVARIERKSKEDLVSSLTHSRERFFREIERLKMYPFRCVLVEGDASDFVHGRYRSATHPNAVMASVCSLLARHGCPVIFAGDAVTAGRMLAGLLRRLEEEHAKAVAA